MYPSLAHFDSSTNFSIVPGDRKRISALDIFGGKYHIRAIKWTIAPKHENGPVFALLSVEFHSHMIPQVVFGHMTLAKFVWPELWTLDTLPQQKKDALDRLGEKFKRLFDLLPLTYPSDSNS